MKIDKKITTVIIVIGLLLLGILKVISLAGTATLATSQASLAQKRKVATGEASSSSVATPQSDISYKELESYQKSGQTWHNIVIATELSSDNLVKLAKQIHRKNPDDSYRIFNDESKLKEFILWDQNYGKVKDKDGKIKDLTECTDFTYCQDLIKQNKYAYPFPEDWSKVHHLGNVQQIMASGGMEWQLIDPFGIKLADL